MTSPLTVQLGGLRVVVDAVRLDRTAFAPFGQVVENPRSDLHPAAGDNATTLPFSGVIANQGSAIKYQHVTHMENFYEQAPSGSPGVAVMNMFVCAARPLVRSSDLGLAPDPNPTDPKTGDIFPVSVLERHPFTTQTFIPLTADSSRRYLVIVAPSLPPAAADDGLPVPNSRPAASPRAGERLPGRGLPDVRRLHAFIATAEQAVTYGAGTWHAPMVALGPPKTALDFVVVQFANGVAVEDCQEVYFDLSESKAAGLAANGSLLVRLPSDPRVAKL
ncbi:ureidoglycolate hydrolase [Cercophora scortea]|uniref:Ureidoglycolate hydrolase n=1 Tax=Cercophora scortea TaxID=314031 RepID=A0AAE0IWV9_9PEZI|nr:ureidoglycolate hydrolase [Cercophora scortea]